MILIRESMNSTNMMDIVIIEKNLLMVFQIFVKTEA